MRARDSFFFFLKNCSISSLCQIHLCKVVHSISLLLFWCLKCYCDILYLILDISNLHLFCFFFFCFSRGLSNFNIFLMNQLFLISLLILLYCLLFSTKFKSAVIFTMSILLLALGLYLSSFSSFLRLDLDYWFVIFLF